MSDSDDIDVSQFTEIKEGKARILYPKSKDVFYNPVQEFNRDTSIAVIKQFYKLISKEKEASRNKKEQRISSSKKDVVPDTEDTTTTLQESVEKTENETKTENVEPTKTTGLIGSEPQQPPLNILEALSASGLRSVRYAFEIGPQAHIVANDISEQAVKSIARNIKHNGVLDQVEASHKDASLLMYQHRYPMSKRFQVVDLDPYGSPSIFLDSAVQAVDEGGLLCITCTDMGALCGNHGEAAYAKYGGMPLRAKYCHEMALRLCLHSIDQHANRYKRYIVPLLSLSADFYIRVFVRVFTSAGEVKRSASKRSLVFHCIGCETFHLQPVGKAVEVGTSKKYHPGTGPPVDRGCENCGHTFRIGGPIWTHPMHDTDFIRDLITSVDFEKDCYGTYPRIKGTLSVIREELADQPLYHCIDQLCNILHCDVPNQKIFRSALIRLGYKVSSTHANKIGFKTDAPSQVIWDILRCWVKQKPLLKKSKENSPAAAILAKEPGLTANFEVLEDYKHQQSKKDGLLRFQVNPTADWGPKARAKSSKSVDESQEEKRKRLQGKRKRKLNDEESGGDQQQQPLKFPYPCKKFKIGECQKAEEDCKYQHVLGDDFSAILCKQFKRGKCQKGTTCKNSHELNNVTDNATAASGNSINGDEESNTDDADMNTA